jgi:hypothetical protein
MIRFPLNAGGAHDAEPALVVPFPGRTPERLVGVGFRCWLAGFETGDIGSWEEAWNAYQGALGAKASIPVVLRLSQFVRAVKANASRDIERYPASALGFCRDECLAISVVAACQHDARQALCTCAAALIGCNDIGDTLASAQEFARELEAVGQKLNASSICAANCPLIAPHRRLQ